MKISIIGNGFVGNAVHQGMKEHYDVLVYDIDPQKSLNNLDEINKVKSIFSNTEESPTFQKDKNYYKNRNDFKVIQNKDSE